MIIKTKCFILVSRRREKRHFCYCSGYTAEHIERERERESESRRGELHFVLRDGRLYDSDGSCGCESHSGLEDDETLSGRCSGHNVTCLGHDRSGCPRGGKERAATMSDSFHNGSFSYQWFRDETSFDEGEFLRHQSFQDEMFKRTKTAYS